MLAAKITKFCCNVTKISIGSAPTAPAWRKSVAAAHRQRACASPLPHPPTAPGAAPAPPRLRARRSGATVAGRRARRPATNPNPLASACPQCSLCASFSHGSTNSLSFFVSHGRVAWLVITLYLGSSPHKELAYPKARNKTVGFISPAHFSLAIK